MKDMKFITRFKDVVEELFRSSSSDEKTYSITYPCNFELVVVKEDETNNYLTLTYKCTKITITYYSVGISPNVSIQYIGNNRGVDDEYFILLNPKLTQYSEDKQAIFVSSLYISDNIIHIKKFISECLVKEVNKKLDEIAALYNKYDVNKI